jgi:hypothetical protein
LRTPSQIPPTAAAATNSQNPSAARPNIPSILLSKKNNGPTLVEMRNSRPWMHRSQKIQVRSPPYCRPRPTGRCFLYIDLNRPPCTNAHPAAGTGRRCLPCRSAS